jgi:hypothetical protein
VTHVWTVEQNGKELGTVEAVSRKGACHAAFEKFDISPEKQKTISVVRLTPVSADDEELTRELIGDIPRDLVRHRSGVVIGIDPAKEGEEGTVYTEVSQDTMEHVLCSFNPALAKRPVIVFPEKK